MERTLYNGLISGVSLDGKTFFYPESARVERPARAAGVVRRRLLPRQHHALHGVGARLRLRAAARRRPLYVNLYAGGTGRHRSRRAASVKVDAGHALSVGRRRQDDRDAGPRARRSPINVRIPGWARNEPVPSDLYRFVDTPAPRPTLKVNGQPVAADARQGLRRRSTRTWKAGDVDRPRPADAGPPHRRQRQVEADRDRVALQRGPIVYAAEWPDNPNGKVRNIVLPDANALTTEFRPDLLNGVQVIKGRAVGLALDADGSGAEDRAAVHGDPVRDVGESRPRPDGGLAGAHRRRRAADAVSDGRDDQRR